MAYHSAEVGRDEMTNHEADDQDQRDHQDDDKDGEGFWAALRAALRKGLPSFPRS